jgi:hypothetical protein
MTAILIGLAIVSLIIQGIQIDRKINKLDKTLKDYIDYMEKQQRFKDFIATRVKNKY